MFSQIAKFGVIFLSLGQLDGCPGAQDLKPIALEASAPLELGEPSWQIPILPDPKLVLLEVHLNQQGPFLFALDTGMSELACLDLRIQKQLGLPELGGRLSNDGGGRFGYQARSQVQNLAVGGFQTNDLPVLVANLDWLKNQDGRPVDGVLGFALFRQFLLQIDCPGGQVRLYQGSLKDSKSTHTLQLQPRRKVPYIHMRVDGKFTRALLDSGFDGGLALPGSMMSRVECLAEPRLTGRLRTAHSDDRRIHTGKLKGQLTLAGYRLDQPPIQFLEGYRSAVLGRRALDLFVPVFDQRSHRVHLQLAK
jgi:predicted aspartyl protease